MASKAPHVLSPRDPSTGRAATFIFLHGYADDGEGLPLALAQQFQFHKKLPYLKWLLPTADRHADLAERAWYKIKALPSGIKPAVPDSEEEKEALGEPDDEEGILKTCAYVDTLVQDELDSGVEPGRIIVGGFSQGCAVSLVWGQTSPLRSKVGGIVCLSGYFPLRDRISAIRTERGIAEDEKPTCQWFYIHGSADLLVPMKLFVQGVEELSKYVDRDNIEGHVYEGLGHTTNNALLRDLLGFLGKVIPS
jgi:lysophospholipase-2